MYHRWTNGVTSLWACSSVQMECFIELNVVNFEVLSLYALQHVKEPTWRGQTENSSSILLTIDNKF